MITYFMFATGIENSAPMVNGRRVDEMAKCRHYDLWKTDFDLVEEIGTCYLRYGPPLHRTLVGADKYDWEFADLTFNELRKRDILPIADLCHFGVPDWLGNFQNPDFPVQFSRYARAFAERYPWVQLFTPVNEMFVCALFSARYGWWNEQLATEKSFVTALKHLVRANVLAMQAILEVRPDAIFIQSESSEAFHADRPESLEQTRFLNEIRFLSLDLNYGREVDSSMYRYLMENGMTPREYDFFVEHKGLKRHCVMGNDYYITNEHRVDASGATHPAGEVFGYGQITWQYYDRYRLPVMHTETNLSQGPTQEEAVQWLWKQWANVLHLREDGVPLVGFTWYSLTDQVDWDTALREDNGRVNPLGLYDLDRKIRPVGESYRSLIRNWRAVLPTESTALTVPVFPPSQQDEPVAVEAGKRARERNLSQAES